MTRCEPAPNRDPGSRLELPLHSMPIISVLVGSLSAPIWPLLFGGLSTSNQDGNPRYEKQSSLEVAACHKNTGSDEPI